MLLIRPSFEVLGFYSDDMSFIEKIGRTCYKSEDKITYESAKTFIETILKRGHESVIEHSAMTVKFICDRGVSHELVRHRLCAFSQESTRYVNYKGGCTFIIPPWCRINQGNYESCFAISMPEVDVIWYRSMLDAETAYKELLYKGRSPQQARSVLPNSTKTEIVVTANFREWRHIFRLRCSKAAHPQMRELMIPLLDYLKETIHIIFDDITY